MISVKKENSNKFIEEKGIRCLETFLEKSERIKCYFTRNDKTPLFDGYFHFLNSDGAILKKFDVQIKSSNSIVVLKKGRNKGKYKYKFDVDVLEAIRTKITENPTFYFVVNPDTNEIFFKYLSIDFLVSLDYRSSSKNVVTYYFDESDKLRDLNLFLKLLKDIFSTSNNTITFKSKKEMADIQKSMNSFYKKLDQIDFIIKEIWPQLFKFGIRSSRNDNIFIGKQKMNCVAYAIYPINYGSSESLIQDYNLLNDNLFNHFDTTFEETLDEYLDDCISNILHFYFSETNLLVRFVPDICLSELIYSFLDDLAINEHSFLSKKYFRKFYKDELNYDELLKIMKPLFEITNKIICGKKLEQSDYEYINFFTKFKVGDKIYFDDKKINAVRKQFLVLEELRKRKIIKIQRPWDYYKENSQISFPCFTCDLLDKDKFLLAVDSVLSNLINHLSYVLKQGKLFFNDKIKGDFSYEVKLVNNPIHHYTIEIVLENESDKFHIKQTAIDYNKLYSRRCWSDIEDLFSEYTPIYNCLKILLNSVLCKNLKVKNKGVLIGSKNYTNLLIF